jgi:hypothetical protein
MPMSINDIRQGIAILPNWNQDRNLEFFVVPEGCNIVVLQGRAASMQLPSIVDHRPAIYYRLQLNQHYDQIFVNQAIGSHPLDRRRVTNHYLQGGIQQIHITQNWASGHGVGVAFAGYIHCIAIVQTGFDVETQ